MQNTKIKSLKAGFTLVEVLIAMAIFMMVMTAVYSTWIAIVRGSKAGLQAAAQAQRARIAVRYLQDALVTAVNYGYAGEYGFPYRFLGNLNGDFSELSFAAKLPSSFPGVSRYGGNTTRRVTFRVERGENQKDQLVVEQFPLLLPSSKEDFTPFKLVLSPEVTRFEVEFFDADAREGKNWTTEWINNKTNTLPSLVRIRIEQSSSTRKEAPQDVTVTAVSIPAAKKPPTRRR